MNLLDIEQIVEQLEEAYQDEEIPEKDMVFLKEMLDSLGGFEGIDSEIDDAALQEILECWLELRSEMQNKK
ncbi:MAG TPA: hypothetical protein QKA08_03095 [Candidatus Megaira endosymbiont of Nemacystus decipiens]|nr:hypothetical protein [Candidatus Megaera endosymbiont of Nemacystus decipiens]